MGDRLRLYPQLFCMRTIPVISESRQTAALSTVVKHHSSFGCPDLIETLAILQLRQLSCTQHTSFVPVHKFNRGPNTNRTSRRCK